MGGDALCCLLGLGAGRRTCPLGTHHNPFSQAHILDVEPARSFAKGSSAQVTTPQLRNFPGWLLISASRCSFQHASAPFQPLPGRSDWVRQRNLRAPSGVRGRLPIWAGRGDNYPSPPPFSSWRLKICLLGGSLKQPVRLRELKKELFYPRASMKKHSKP